MTTFQYRNDGKLSKLATMAFGEKGAISDIQREEMVKGYKYVLAYCIVYSKKVNSAACELVRKASISFDKELRNLVFFEKAKDGRDFIYFDEYMKEQEANAGFLKTWGALQEALAV